MKIMNEYTYLQIKKNKRHTISILVAITIASALLLSLCIFLYSFWQAKITSTIESTGYWHGELWESVSGDELKYVTENPEVESTMVKGKWLTAQLSDTKRPYLLMRDGDLNFWNDMNLKNTITEGRLPTKKGEIVVAKQFFSDNPSYHIGDILTLPVGNRMLGDSVLQTQDYKQDNEKFEATGTKVYTIVGTLDVSGVSAYSGYIAMGYLEIAEIQPSDELTVYMRLVHPYKIYEVLPTIAESAGLSKDERGQYGIRYNASLLNLYGISDKSPSSTQFIVMAAMAVILLLLVMGTFVLIIYNAFSLSANSRARDLSILKSLGATPKQIKFSVLYEGLLLWLIQSPIGIVIGYAFSFGIFSKMNGILIATDDYKKMNLSFSWSVVAFSLIISLITVLVSAYIPAKKMAKVPVVEGIGQISSKIKKPRNYNAFQKVFGMEGELAGKQFATNKKSLRTAIFSLSLCLILIVSYVTIISIYNLAESKNDEITQYGLTVNLNLTDNPDNNMIQSIRSLLGVKDSVVHRQVRATTYVTKAQESDVFLNAGGFASVDDLKYNIAKKDDKFKIVVNLVGLSDDSFQTYCEAIGTDFEKYYNNNDTTMGILLDSTDHVATNSKTVQKIPMLRWTTDTSMHLYEKVFDDTDDNYEFDIQVGDITEKEPGQITTSRYSATLVLPMEKYQQLASYFMSERKLEANRMSLDLVVGNENSAEVKEKIQKICSSYLGSEDFTVWSLLEEKEHDALVQKAISVVVYAVAIMIGIIGIFNAFSTISNNLQVHKREYAMLRSVGLTPRGLNKMLLLEGLLFALSPIIISIPCIMLICWYMLKLTAISWHEFLSVFPSGAILIYTGCIIIAIFLAYLCSSKTIKGGNIIESIQNEII